MTDPADYRVGLTIPLLCVIIVVAFTLAVLAASSSAQDVPGQSGTPRSGGTEYRPVPGGVPLPAAVNVTASEGLSLTSSMPVTASGTVLTRGLASWYADGDGLYGAVHSFRWGDPTYPVEVCRADDPQRCVTVTVRDHMGNPTRAIDLSPAAFSRLAPLSAGLVVVTVTHGRGLAGPEPTLPATETLP